MSGAAPLRVALRLSQDATFAFTFRPRMRDGSAFAWPLYSFDYALRGEESGSGFALTEAAGIDRRTDLGVIVLRRPDPHGLPAGRYRHVLRITHRTGLRIPLFDGTVQVTEGMLP